MKRCKTCEHWDSEPGDNWGDCIKAGTTDSQPDDSNSLAHAYDTAGYSATLQTSAAFGCIQWERKEKNPAGKTRKQAQAYAEWIDNRTGWHYWLLKSWQAKNSQHYARWFVEVSSDFTHGGTDMGDEYVSNLLTGLTSVGIVRWDTSIWPTKGEFLQWAFN